MYAQNKVLYQTFYSQKYFDFYKRCNSVTGTATCRIRAGQCRRRDLDGRGRASPPACKPGPRSFCPGTENPSNGRCAISWSLNSSNAQSGGLEDSQRKGFQTP